ncbi:tRNA/rRNA methyltransferase [Palleronia aestuarii]|uniref:tRNA (cytidine/uridine-2'-O-)-methyltransferase TrmJ n=1 Tax=Palleronia aestuarii TaxID=568105 RepID=A0A2W7NP16_9RHOB|nr:RNA methyltransferase [Palleronia aestuarii]PZX19887.1 tRNA/rRNA methyltransferase [Palleronia aestuarii]
MPETTTSADAPVIVLVRPQMGENIGAAARAMLNFGLQEMRVVAPRDGWPNPRAEALASGATPILDHARITPNLPAALDDCSYVLATTARRRDMTKPVLDPEAAMVETRARIARGERVAILFGPERAGLENDDVARANAIVSVPVNPDFPSLNLAQCVLLLGYEWRRLAPPVPGTDIPPPETATALEVEHLASHWERQLDTAGFFFPPDKAGHMKRLMRNLWSRMPLTRADVQVLHGALRQLVRRPDGSG